MSNTTFPPIRPKDTVIFFNTTSLAIIMDFVYDGNPAGHVMSGHSGSWNANFPSQITIPAGASLQVTVGTYSGNVGLNTDWGQGSHTSDVLPIKETDYVKLNTNADWVLIGQTTPHPDAWWITSSTKINLRIIADAYNDETNKRLRMNDASLHWGGRFRIAGDFSTVNENHKRHRLGINIDIADNVGMNSNQWATFEAIAWAHNATKVNHEVSRNHWHLEF